MSRVRISYAPSVRYLLSPATPMDVTSLQCEINHLLFLYYTSIGVIQRDYAASTIDTSIDALVSEIAACRARIESYLNGAAASILPLEGSAETIESAREYFEDAQALIDAITNTDEAVKGIKDGSTARNT